MARAVFVEPPRPDVDVSGVERYGPIVCLFGQVRQRRGPGSLVPAQHSHRSRPSVSDVNDFARAVSEQLDAMGYDPEADYIVMTGGHHQVAMAFAVLSERYRRFRMLMFSSNTESYVVKVFDIDEATKGSKPCRGTDTTQSTRPSASYRG